MLYNAGAGRRSAVGARVRNQNGVTVAAYATAL
jgi:hypothetical protein